MGRFRRICTRHLWCQIGSILTNFSLSVSSGSYCTSAIVGFSVYGNTFATLFTHFPRCVDCETFSGRNQSIGCYLAWVTIARDSESEHPFYPVGKFPRFAQVTNFCIFLFAGRICNIWYLNQSTVLTEGCDWTNVGHPAGLFKIILVASNLPVTCWHPWSFIVVSTAPKTNNFDLLCYLCTLGRWNVYSFQHSILRCNSAGFVKDTYGVRSAQVQQNRA